MFFLIQAHANMCAGYYKLMVAAKQEHKILIPNPQFDNEVVRYEHRFGAFANLLTPPLMPYTQFKVGKLLLLSIICSIGYIVGLYIIQWFFHHIYRFYFQTKSVPNL